MMRLYDMDANPERRMFLDRLLSYMEDRGSPITQCPTISKNPLDLYTLYIYTKDKGGYLEVRCATSKNTERLVSPKHIWL
jgi:AT-rich interactive domain-containing protein 1